VKESRNSKEAPRVQVRQSAEGRVRVQDSIDFGGLPTIIDGLVRWWPAIERWTAENLIARCGSESVEVFLTSPADGTVLQQVNGKVTLSFREFIEHTFGLWQGGAARSYYLRVGPGTTVFDELCADFTIPDTGHPFNPKWTGLWLGQAGNATPFHHDWWHGLLAQIRGRKRYTLVHPFDVPRLQRDWSDAAKFDLSAAEILPAGAPILDELDLCFEGTLLPGEMLYVPPYWFHQVVTLDDGNISMPIRFDTPQMPDVALFQLSQDSCLREVTNQPVKDVSDIVRTLSRNRAKFFDKEESFVRALCAIRDLDAEEVVRELASTVEITGGTP